MAAIPAIDTPDFVLPEITLPAACTVAPKVTPVAFAIETPLPELGSGWVPVWSVPIKLPWTSVLMAPPPTSIPSPEFPEITLRARLPVPPMVVPVPPAMSMPAVRLARAPVPSMSVPIKFPAIKVPVVAASVTLTPSAFPEMKLRTTHGPADRISRGTSIDQHASARIADRQRSSRVGADQVALDRV